MAASNSSVNPALDITVLGSGDAFCSGGHHNAAYLFETGASTFLVDCGPTILLSMKQRKLDTARIDFVVVSHLHGDHFGGLPFLLLEYMWENPRTRPLIIVGPPGMEARLWELSRALYRDIGPDKMPYPVDVRELTPDRPMRLADVEILPVQVPHQVDEVSLAYQFTTGGKRVVYTGDSPWVDRFVDLSRDVDLFLCECTAYESPMGRHVEWRTLKPCLPKLDCRRLVLVHLGREMRAHADELGVECATEGLTIRV